MEAPHSPNAGLPPFRPRLRLSASPERGPFQVLSGGRSSRIIDRPHFPSYSVATAKRILLVEDNPVNQEIARIYLSEMPAVILLAENGRDALELVRHQQFDLIVMDVQMPVMDGIAATRHIRALEAAAGRPPTPILALTANAMVGDREACLAAGMDDYLSKPFKPGELIARAAHLAGIVLPH